MTDPLLPAGGVPGPDHPSPAPLPRRGAGRGLVGRIRAVLARRWLRRLVVWGGLMTVVGIVGVVAVVGWWWSRAAIDTVGTHDFANPLAIPPLLEPEPGGDGRSVFRLTLQEGTSELLPEITTETWGVNGAHLGPTLRAQRGDTVIVHVDNDLPEPTTLHWHGMHLPAAADGGPHQMIDPGQTWSPSWEIDQPAATLWYHPHPHGQTADHVYRGLAGLFLVEDGEAPPELPSDYGVDDIPVIVQDKRFHGNGSLDAHEPRFGDVGQLGDRILINGTIDPHVEVAHEHVRLRVLNGSNARVYDLGFDDDRPFQLVATDGGLLASPHTTTRVPLSPGERAELVVRLQPGERTVLRSTPPDLGVNPFSARFAGGDDRFDLLQLRAADDLVPAPPLPDQLGALELPDPAEAVATRRFALQGGSLINRRQMDERRIDEVVTVDTTEIWEVTNQSGRPHNLHIHDVQFRVVDLGSRPLPGHLQGPKDTVFLPPGATARLALRFTDHTDPAVPYMFHCHLLAHEDSGMMGQFTVVDPDDAGSAPRRIDARAHDHH